MLLKSTVGAGVGLSYDMRTWEADEDVDSGAFAWEVEIIKLVSTYNSLIVWVGQRSTLFFAQKKAGISSTL